MAEDQKPIPFAEIARAVQSREALVQAPPMPPLRQFYASEGGELGIQVTQRRMTDTTDQSQRVVEVETELRGARLGVHAFGPAVKGIALDGRRRLERAEDHAQMLTPYLPDHLALRALPAKLPSDLRMAKRIDALARGDLKMATTVFAPEDRYLFNDTAYPWCATGKVETAGGWASGVMIGPRHLLTCSHAISWLPAGGPYACGWIKFTPSFFDGSAPFGTAWATHIYWDRQVTGPTIDNTEEQYDYVSVVLDRPIGSLTGWMGTRRYTDGWDGGSYWSHIGYPGDLASGQRPSFQGNFALDGSASQPDDHEVMTHKADVWPGQSGGPMFGWWSGEVGPRVVSVQSWQNSKNNGASGGGNLVDLVIRARNDFA